MAVEFFKDIKFVLPQQEIYSRLGYANKKTKLSSKQNNLIKDYLDQAADFIKLKGACQILNIEKAVIPKIFLSDNITFTSKSLAKLLEDCSQVLLMAVTAGSKIMQAIKENTENDNLTKAVVFDAVASEVTDKALTWIMNYFSYQLRRENKEYTKMRFSAGYGDFSLVNQKIFYEVLNLKKIGVTLTPEYILIPEKSVTAVVGIRSKTVLR